jgi:PIN domain nuclease of toxin-antitoxin system
LPGKVVQVIEDSTCEINLSAVSIWEAAIKIRSGRLDLEGRRATDLIAEATDMGVRLIGLEPHEAATHGQLTEDTHFDPFDRMLIRQAVSRDLTLISGDKEFGRFKRDGLRLLWK